MDWSTLTKRMKQSHARLRAVVAAWERDVTHQSADSVWKSDLESVLVAHFKIHHDDLYRNLKRQMNSETKAAALVHALQQGLIILKVLFLEFLDGERNAMQKFVAELKARITLEEAYLLPLLEANVQQAITKDMER